MYGCNITERSVNIGTENIRRNICGKKRKPKMELRYYKMPEGSPILALLGQKWVQNYGNDIDYLHFHNYLEIGFCYEGQGFMILGEDKVQFHDRIFSVIPANYPHTTNSDIGTISRWEYLFIDVEGFLDKFINNSVKEKKSFSGSTPDRFF